MARRQTITAAGTNARHLGGGYVRTTGGEAWLFAQVPAQPPVRDASSWDDRENNARPWLTALPRIAELTPHIPFVGRKAMKGFYREIHILAISTPQPYEPSPILDAASRFRLARDFGDHAVHDRFTLLGVRLTAGTTGGGRRGMWARLRNMVTTMAAMDGTGMAPDDDFAADRAAIAEILTDAGCTIPDEHMMRRALAWWRTDRKPEIVPVMVEHEHMHTFPDYRSCKRAERFFDAGGDCATWTQREPFSYPMTIVTLGPLPFEGQEVRQITDSDWAATLMAQSKGGGQGALALSIRALLEPGELTREQIDKDKELVYEKAVEQATDGHKRNVRTAADLDRVDDAYQSGEKPWPTLIEVRAHAAVPQIVDRPSQIIYPGDVSLNPERQDAAFQDMMIGSPIVYNPSPLYWPVPVVAYAGLAGRSVAGDDMGRGGKTDLPGALLGFTETDAQPVYVSPFESRETHNPPCLLVTGATGSGKTRVLLWLASQMAALPDPYRDGAGRVSKHRIPYEQIGHPVRIPGVFLDPKPNSDDFEPFIRKHHGVIIRLDSTAADGILDPLRCMPAGTADRVQTAVEMLSQITAGEYGDKSRELALNSILYYGDAHGADCMGEAIDIAHRAYGAHEDGWETIDPLVDEIAPAMRRNIESNPMLRIIYGTRHGGRSLAVSEGLTLLSAGTMNIIADPNSQSVPSIIQRWVVRMAALGAGAAIQGRNGFLIVDEAWSLLGDRFGASLVNRIGRLARAQHYFPIFASQKVDEFVNVGLQDFVGRGIILGLGARNEGGTTGESQAQAVCRLFNIPPDGRLHERMMHARVLDAESQEPDYESLYALVDPHTGRIVRGSVPYYVGPEGDAIPVEVNVPDELI